MTDPEDYLIAGMAALVVENNSLNHGILPASFTVDVAVKDLSKALNISLKRAFVQSTLDRMALVGMCIRIDDPYAPTFYTLDERELSRYADECKPDRSTPYGKVDLLGLGWIETALEGIQANPEKPSWRSLPAPDTLIELNSYQASQINNAISEIAESIETSNELGDMLGDDRRHISNELRAGGQLVAPGKVRLHALLAVLMRPLRFIAKTFSEQAIGDLASALIVELLKLMRH